LPCSPTAVNNPAATPRLAPLTARISAVGMQSRMPAAKAPNATWMLLTVTWVEKLVAVSDE
jgi:hypothetical protein